MPEGPQTPHATDKDTAYRGRRPPVAGLTPAGPSRVGQNGGVRRRLKRALLRVAGRPVRCELCGEPLFRALPVATGGRIKVQGAEHALVRVEFASMNHLVFRHLEADRCPALRRPA